MPYTLLTRDRILRLYIISSTLNKPNLREKEIDIDRSTEVQIDKEAETLILPRDRLTDAEVLKSECLLLKEIEYILYNCLSI